MSTIGDNNDRQYIGSGEMKMKSSKKECTSCEQNNVDVITEGIGLHVGSGSYDCQM